MKLYNKCITLMSIFAIIGFMSIISPKVQGYEDVTFCIEPVDENYQVVTGCTLTLYERNNTSNNHTFTAYPNGVIEIHTADINWYEGYIDAKMEINDPNDEYFFGDVYIAITSGMIINSFQACGMNAESFSTSDKQYSATSQIIDELHCGNTWGWPMKAWYTNPNSDLLFHLTYSAHFGSSGTEDGSSYFLDNYRYRITIKEWYCEAYKWDPLTQDWEPNPKITKNIGDPNDSDDWIIGHIDLTDQNTENDDWHFDPTWTLRLQEPFFNRGSKVQFEIGASWKLEFYSTSSESWESYKSGDYSPSPHLHQTDIGVSYSTAVTWGGTGLEFTTAPLRRPI